jgi:hypothetical protein
MNGLGPKEFEKISKLTLNTSSARLPNLTSDRGLLSPSSKQIKQALVGPGAYTDHTLQAFVDKSFKVKPGSFGTAVRDTHFSKYSSLHS